MIPVTRKEQYLNRLTGEEQTIPETPITRTEQYLARLCGMETEIPSSPITREEAYLAYLNGEDVTLPEPITRLEQFMAFAAGESETKPTPLTREELYWDKYQGGAVLKDFPGLPASIVTVTDALAKPLDSLKVDITLVQEGSGDPSPENVRPISGWTGANIFVVGENVFDKTAVTTGKYLKEDGTTTNSSQWNISDYIRIDSSLIYSGLETITPSPYSAFYDGNKTLMQTFKQKTGDNVVSVPAGAEYVRFSVRNSDIDTFKVFTAGTAYTIPFTDGTDPLTIYGGTLDVVNGTLTVTHGYISNLRNRSWTNTSTASAFVMVNDIPGIVNAGPSPSSPQVDIICSKYQPTPKIMLASDLPDKKCTINSNGRKLVIADSSYSSVNDFAQSLSDVQFVYELETPLTYQLTPTEVQMLLGTNNIWADTGDILEGKYYAKR